MPEHPWELPWAEPFADGSPERAQLAIEFAAAVRKTGSLMQLVGQFAADRIGINATDLNCLNILSFSGQMTAGDLDGAEHELKTLEDLSHQCGHGISSHRRCVDQEQAA